MARIVMIRESRTKEYELAQEVILGRKSTCTIRVPSPKCSREHCRIFKGANGFFIEDMGSSNGTVVNDKKIGSHLLANNDEIEIGGVKFKFYDKTDDPLVGKRLDKYQVLDKVGVGGMGVVYRASQVTLGREVALKVMSRKYADQEDFIQSFEREAKLAARLQHPNIIGIHDYGCEDGWYFFSMEYIDGENLLDMALRQGGLSIEECLRFGAQLAEALEHAHAQGILHKDIKPQNVMIDRDDNVKLADMGLASVMGGEDEEEFGGGGGAFMATPQYVAPEIIRRQEPDARSDLYSLSATLYHMLTGRPPFKSKDIKDLLKMHLKDAPVNPRELRSEIPQTLADFILKGLAKSPDDRQQNARVYAEGLRGIAAKLGASADENTRKLIQSTVSVKRSSAKTRTVMLSRDRLEQDDKPGVDIAKLLKNRYVLGGAAALVVIIVLLCLGKSPEEEAQFILRQAKQLYTDGADDAAQKKLEEIVMDYPSTTAANEARHMIELSSGSRAQQELYRIKSEIAKDKIKREDGVRQLKLFLRQGLASKQDKELIQKYIITLGQDPDLRSKWEKSVDSFKEKDELNNALEYLDASALDVKNPADKALLKRMRDDIQTLIEKKAMELCDEARYQQVEKKNAQACYELFLKASREYPSSGKWHAFSVSGIAKLNELSARHYYRAITALAGAIKEGDLNKIREVGFRYSEAMAQTPLKRLPEQVVTLQKCYEAFYKKFNESAYGKTTAALDQVRMKIGGKEVTAVISGEKDGIVAVIDGKPTPIVMADIPADEVSRIVPRLGVTEQEALGAALYFYSVGNKLLSRDYSSLVSALNEQYSPAAREIELFAEGIAPVNYLSLMSAQKARNKNCTLSRGGTLTFYDKGSYANPGAALLLNNAVVNFDGSNSSGLVLSGNNRTLATVSHDSAMGVVRSGKLKKEFLWPDGGVRVSFLKNGQILVKSYDGKEIATVKLAAPPLQPASFVIISDGKSTVTRFDVGVESKTIVIPEAEGQTTAGDKAQG